MDLTELLNSRIGTVVDASTLKNGEQERFKAVFDAGADIIELPVKMGQEALVAAAAETNNYNASHREKKVFFAGCLDLSDDFRDHEFDFDEFAEDLKADIKQLIDAGVDIVHFKSVRYTPLVKAAIYALKELEEELKNKKSLFISCVVEETGRMKCGQTVAAFAVTVEYAHPMIVGVEFPGIATGGNILREVIKYVDVYTSLTLGANCRENLSEKLSKLDSVNVLVIAGCEGLTNIRSVIAESKELQPRKLQFDRKSAALLLAGAEPLRLYETDRVDFRNLLKIGQRCDVPNLNSFREIILQIAKLNDEICEMMNTEDPPTPVGRFKYPFRGIKYLLRKLSDHSDMNQEMLQTVMKKIVEIKGLRDKALGTARNQVALGAQVLNILFDPITYAMPNQRLPGTTEWMRWFVQLVESDHMSQAETSDVVTHAAATPLCINSGSMEVIEEGLKYSIGRGIANAISLAGGEESFRRDARALKKLGPAAVIAIALLKNGRPAKRIEDKVAICLRMYRILLEEIGYDSNEIILDPMVTRTAPNAPNLHSDDYGWTFIKAAEEIRGKLGNVRIMGGITGVSQVFRQEPGLRCDMNRTFLKQCMQVGMNTAIMDVEDVADETKGILLEDLVTNRDPGARGKLKDFYRAEKSDEAERYKLRSNLD